MKVCEIFSSIQGEGLLIGVPTIFVRFTGCNLRCRWCDTTYAFQEGRMMDIPTVLKHIPREPKWVCLTGGEPLLQEHEQLEQLIEALRETHKVTIETNGTIEPSRHLLELVDFWSVSPKLSNSGMKDKLNVRALRIFSTHPHVQFKFVIEKTQDIDEAFQMMDANDIHGTTVLQPQGYKDIIKTLREIALYVKDSNRDVRVLPQLHVLMWNHRRSI